MSQWSQIRPIIDELVNRQFDTAEFKKLFAVPLTPGRIKVYQNHMTFYAANRRDCWSFVAGKAPIDVKRAIWEHEKDELIHDDRMGRAHVTESDLQAGDESLLAPGAKAAFYAWLYCAREKPWLEGLVYSHILERRNNNAIVKGGGLVERWKRKQRAELGIKEAEKDFQTEVHAVADEDHSDIFEPVFARYVVSERAGGAGGDAGWIGNRSRFARRAGGRDVGGGVNAELLGPAIATRPEKWDTIVGRDKSDPRYDYNELARNASPSILQEITPEKKRRRWDACQKAVEKLHVMLQEARPDVAVVVSGYHRPGLENTIVNCSARS